MAFGSNDFPLGPNGQYPRQRIGVFNDVIAPPNRVEDVYRGNPGVKLPVIEKNFISSVERIKNRMKQGRIMRQGQRANKFRPKTQVSGLGATRDWRSWFGTLFLPKAKARKTPVKQTAKAVATKVFSSAAVAPVQSVVKTVAKVPASVVVRKPTVVASKPVVAVVPSSQLRTGVRRVEPGI